MVIAVMNNGQQSKDKMQLFWAVALILVGVAVFFRIPQVIPQLVQMGLPSATLWFIRICLYLMGIMLIGGGIRKIMQRAASKATGDPQSPDKNDTASNR